MPFLQHFSPWHFASLQRMQQVGFSTFPRRFTLSCDLHGSLSLFPLSQLNAWHVRFESSVFNASHLRVYPTELYSMASLKTIQLLFKKLEFHFHTFEKVSICFLLQMFCSILQKNAVYLHSISSLIPQPGVQC